MIGAKIPKSEAQRGDTLIEVLLSMAILSLVIIGATVLMNSGMASVISGVEHTQVRNSVASQGELLRYIRDQSVGDAAFRATWNNITNTPRATLTKPVVADCKPVTGRSFYLQLTQPASSTNKPTIEAKDASASPNDSYAKPGSGMWIDAVKSTGAIPEYIDFYITACWNAAGSTTQQQTNTVVRLYRP